MNVLLLDEVAAILRCSEAEVLAEIQSGRLKAFAVAGRWRVLEGELLRFVSGSPQADAPVPASPQRGATMSPTSVVEHAESFAIRTGSMLPFTYVWPDGEPNEYQYPLSVTVEHGGKRAYFVIGKAKSPKKQLGQIRWRYNVFLTASPGSTQGLVPVLDFVAGNDFDRDSLMASLIKRLDGKLVKENEPIPPEYRDFRLVPFNQVVRGPYARSGLAVVADKDDLQTMIRHAVVRAIQKGWIRW
jgi:hypothetical protein